MKKILMMLSIAFLLGACSKDKNEENQQPALKQQIMVDGVTKSIKGAAIDKFKRGFDFFCDADRSDAELAALGEGAIRNVKSHYMMLCVGSDVEIGETMSGTYNLAVGTNNENGESVILAVTSDGKSAYNVMVKSDGYIAAHTTDVTADEPPMTTLTITAGTLTYALSGGDIEIKLDVKFSNGETIKAHYKGAPADIIIE